MDSDRGQWLKEQVAVSAHRLINSPPALLSPTGRRLREEAATWVAAHAHSPVEQREAPGLRIVPSVSSRSTKGDDQLPLIATAPDQ
jgi:hypothetical protein